MHSSGIYDNTWMDIHIFVDQQSTSRSAWPQVVILFGTEFKDSSQVGKLLASERNMHSGFLSFGASPQKLISGPLVLQWRLRASHYIAGNGKACQPSQSQGLVDTRRRTLPGFPEQHVIWHIKVQQQIFLVNVSCQTEFSIYRWVLDSFCDQ